MSEIKHLLDPFVGPILLYIFRANLRFFCTSFEQIFGHLRSHEQLSAVEVPHILSPRLQPWAFRAKATIVGFGSGLTWVCLFEGTLQTGFVFPSWLPRKTMPNGVFSLTKKNSKKRNVIHLLETNIGDQHPHLAVGSGESTSVILFTKGLPKTFNPPYKEGIPKSITEVVGESLSDPTKPWFLRLTRRAGPAERPPPTPSPGPLAAAEPEGSDTGPGLALISRFQKRETDVRGGRIKPGIKMRKERKRRRMSVPICGWE